MESRDFTEASGQRCWVLPSLTLVLPGLCSLVLPPEMFLHGLGRGHCRWDCADSQQ